MRQFASRSSGDKTAGVSQDPPFTALRAVKQFASDSSSSGSRPERPALRAVKLFAVGTSNRDGSDLDPLRHTDPVRSYSSHGRVPNGPDSPEVKAHQEVGVNSYLSAGFQPVGDQMEPAEQLGYPHILISYAYDEDCTFFAKKLGYNPPNWMGDSGAFTAWTVGKRIDLDGLIQWCRWHLERNPAFVCISLDVIPGQPGGNNKPTKREQARAMKASLENGDAMRAAGLKIMEVYHVFEPIKHLDLILERRQPGELVGIGGMVRRSTSLKRDFCDTVFHRVKQHQGGTWEKAIPVHGLGLSIRSELAARYPWWSIDSSSWIAPAMYGHEVSEGGKIIGGDDRTSHRSVRHIYLTRTLEGWLARERALTELWHRRGVRYIDEPGLVPA